MSLLPNTVINGNCLEVMKEIDDASIDMILCDLPYGATQNSWDSVIPPAPLWEQYERIIKPNGAILLFGQDKFTATMMLSNPKLHRYNIIWDKVLKSGFLNAKKMPLREHEDTVVAADLDEQDVKEVMLASGATFPLSTIEATTQEVLISAIKIPGYMARTKPSDEKIAKRFLEFYHTGQFNTNVALDDNAVLIDGYSAYLVAQKVGLTFLPAIYKEV